MQRFEVTLIFRVSLKKLLDGKPVCDLGEDQHKRDFTRRMGFIMNEMCGRGGMVDAQR